ncbi:MAG: pimeloyl-ACP methyl ester carboxylesterase [Granulosicoccus sp.]|jgi:pimeloyl-ACP methyl ester carboxylesterase
MNGWKLDEQFSFDEGMVRYGITGAGEDVVLVHGTPWSSFTWHLLIPVLSTCYRVHYYDFVGYGQSDKSPSQNVSLDVQGKLLTELLAHWNLKTPKVIAHDYGGAVSLRAHLLHGCNFSSLQLIDVVALAPWGSPFFAHIQKHEEAFAGVPDYIHQAIVRAYIDGAIHGTLDDKQLSQLINPWLTESGKSAFYRQIAQADQKYTDEIEPLYTQIRCPVSILWGEKDEWIPLETGKRLHVAIPNSTFELIPNAGHLAQLENPQFVHEKVKIFLSL